MRWGTKEIVRTKGKQREQREKYREQRGKRENKGKKRKGQRNNGYV